MNVFTAPEINLTELHRPVVFLAGGINNCPDWQSELIGFLQEKRMIGSTPGTVLNPRRANFDVKDPNAATGQIAWEHYAFRLADIICFWFARGSLNPIVLYELGVHQHHERIIVGCDPVYERRTDVQAQLWLARPSVRVHLDFDAFKHIVFDAMRGWHDYAARPR